MPPELIRLGDQLEAAAARALARRRVRRQQVLNAVASLIVAVPITASVIATQARTSTVVPPPTPTATVAPAAHAAVVSARMARDDDFPPRDLRRMREAPNSALLVLPSSLRPALR